MKLQTSLYDASTGRSGGGNFQLVTKSGGNKFSGSAYYYIQNEALNANDYFYNRDGIDKPKARRHEGGFTLGGPVIADKLFFFGGYQYTKADTGFVPTASSMTVLPEALGLIQGDRTPANLVAAFKQLNPAFPQISSDFAHNYTPSKSQESRHRRLLRSGAASWWYARRIGHDGCPVDWRQSSLRQRNVQPAEFEQNQFTTRLDGQFCESNRLSGVFFFANFPGFDPFPDPSSLASPVTLVRDDRNGRLRYPTFILSVRR